jgi:hypothetical protein
LFTSTAFTLETVNVLTMWILRTVTIFCFEGL